MIDPLSYRDNLKLVRHAKLVLTDSGGLQEETSVLNVPCLTLRDTTERPATVGLRTSELVGNDPSASAPLGGAARPAIGNKPVPSVFGRALPQSESSGA
jgi:UDP-N-acetylglucosamine 2-epimerase (non-hydrolysing)